MKMREIMALVEGKLLLEAAGTYGFYHPKTDTEVLCEQNYKVEHADYVIAEPGKFGCTPEEVQAALDGPDNPEDIHATPDMQRMTRVLNLILAKGWARVNYYRGAWSFHALSLPIARAALKHYASEEWIEEATLEYGPIASHPEWSENLYPRDAVMHFVKTGKRLGT
jgi:hypothetical protein